MMQGLPEAWREGWDRGAFSNVEAYPQHMPPNAEIVVGWFNETLPVFRQHLLRGRPVGLLHVDCDLYSSTREVLEGLDSAIVPGTVIVFDEFVNYPGYELHEFRACAEWMMRYNRALSPIGLFGEGPDAHIDVHPRHQAAAFLVVK
jgi:hypothetical protein